MSVHGFGPLDAKIWVVGESPGDEEVRQGRPFVGASGRLIRGVLATCGANPDLVRYENLMEEKPHNNNFEQFLNDKAQLEVLNARVSRLKAQILEANPNIVILLGNQPCYFMTGNTPISKWRGFVLWQEDIKCKVMATYHPSAVLRQQHVDKTQKPGQYEALMHSDIRKAVQAAATKELNLPAYELVLNPSAGQAEAELLNIRDNADIVSFDIETKGTCMTCIGFATCKTKAICIPLYIVSEKSILEYWSDDITKVHIFKLIREVLMSDIPKIAQNAQFDMTILKGIYQTPVRNLVWDTLCAAHNIYCELPKDLGTLMSLYTNLPYHKYMAHLGSNMAYWEYNALDALSALYIMEAEKAEMIEYGIYNHYYQVTNPMLECLIDMQLNGVKVDVALRNQALAIEEQYQAEIKEAFSEILPKFNPSSPKQVKELLYGKFRMKPIRNQGQITANEAALKTLAEKGDKYVKMLVHAILEYRQSVKMAGTLRTPLDANGRLHTSYSASKVETGRLNSSEPIYLPGTNLQNLQKGIQRQMLIAG